MLASSWHAKLFLDENLIKIHLPPYRECQDKELRVTENCWSSISDSVLPDYEFSHPKEKQQRRRSKQISLAPSTLRRRNFKTEISLWKRIKCFPSTLGRRNLKTQQSLVILDLCLRKPRSGKSRDYRDVIVFDKLCFQNVFRPHENET